MIKFTEAKITVNINKIDKTTDFQVEKSVDSFFISWIGKGATTTRAVKEYPMLKIGIHRYRASR